MFNKLKGLFTNQGFICKNPNDKKRIWQKLTDAGYPMFFNPELDYQLTIVFIDSGFCNFGEVGEPLNEAEFFGENEWTPKAGDWVEVSDVRNYYGTVKHQYLCTIDGLHLCVDMGKDYQNSNEFILFKYIRQIKPEKLTLQEAQEKLRELLNNPKLTIEP